MNKALGRGHMWFYLKFKRRNSVAAWNELSCGAKKESSMAPLTFFQCGAPTYTQNQAWIWKNVGPDKIKISRPIILCVRHD